MEGSGETEKPYEPVQEPILNGRVGFIGYIKCHAQERKAKKQAETPQDRSARITANATHAIAWLTMVVAIIAGLQLWELIRGGDDTKAIANAARQQACAARQIAEASKRNATAAEGFAASAASINGGISDAVGKLNLQAAAMHEVAVQTQNSVKIAGQQLESSERPWMKVALSLYTPNGQTSPISIDANSGALNVAVMVAGQNVGHSPATKIQVDAELIPTSLDTDVEAKQIKMCDDIHNLPAQYAPFGKGDTIFPNDPYFLPRYLNISKAKITSELASPSNRTVAIPGKGNIIFIGGGNKELVPDLPAMVAKNLGGTTAPTLSVIGCLDYTVDYSQQRHQTMFLYELGGIDLRTLTANGLTISKSFGHGNTAN